MKKKSLPKKAKNGKSVGSYDSKDTGYYQNGGQIPMAKDGKWIQKAINPKHKGYCTPMTKSTCTPRRKALAKTLKKMAKRRKGENGVEMPEQDAQMEQIMAMAMQAIQQGASPQEVMQMLVQQGVPQEIAQQIVMQVTQQGQMQEPQEVPQADLGVQVESFGALPLATPSIAGDFTKVPMTDVDQFNQRRQEKINKIQGIRNSFSDLFNPYYNPSNIARNVYDYNQANKLLNSPDASGYSDAELTGITRYKNTSAALIGGYSVAAGRDALMTGLGAYTKSIQNRRARSEYLANLQRGYRDSAEMQSYTSESMLPYAEVGAKVPCAECGKHMAYGGKLGFIAEYGTQVPTHGLDFLSSQPNVNAEGGGKVDEGEIIADKDTGTVVSLRGAPTHRQQDQGARKVNLALSPGSVIIPRALKDTPSNFIERFRNYPTVADAVMQVTQAKNGGKISWADVAEQLNTVPETLALKTLAKQEAALTDVIRMKTKKPLKTVEELEPYLGNKQDTQIAATTDKLNVKFAKRKLDKIQEEFAPQMQTLAQQKQQIEESMTIKNDLVRNVIFPELEGAILNNEYGQKVKKDFMKNNEAKYGKKLPKAKSSLQVPDEKYAERVLKKWNKKTRFDEFMDGIRGNPTQAATVTSGEELPYGYVPPVTTTQPTNTPTVTQTPTPQQTSTTPQVTTVGIPGMVSGQINPPLKEPLPERYATPELLLELMPEYYKGKGLDTPFFTDEEKANPNILAARLQKDIIANDPEVLYNLIRQGAIPLTNKAKTIYQKHNPKDPNVSEEELRSFFSNPANRQLVLDQFGDELWGTRLLMMEDKDFTDKAQYDEFIKGKKHVGKGYYYDMGSPITGHPKIYRAIYTWKADGSKAPVTYPKTNVTFSGTIAKKLGRKQLYYDPLHPMAVAGPVAEFLTPRDVTPFIEDTGAKDALAGTTKKQLTEIQPQLSRLRRATLAQTRGVGIDPVSQAQMAQAYANEYEAAAQAYGTKYNLDAAINQNYIEMQNALREKAGTNRANALNLLAQREATSRWKQTAKDINALNTLGDRFLKNRAENRASLLYQDMFPNVSYDGYTTSTVGGSRYPIVGGSSVVPTKDQAQTQKLMAQTALLLQGLGLTSPGYTGETSGEPTFNKYGKRVKLPKKSLKQMKSVK